MKKPTGRTASADIRVVPAAAVRRALTSPGDVRTEVAFQNDINGLLARFDEVQSPWIPVAGPVPTFPALIVSDITPMPAPPRARPPVVASPRPATAAPRLRVVQGQIPRAARPAAPPPAAALDPAAMGPTLSLSTEQVTLPSASKARGRSPLRRA